MESQEITVDEVRQLEADADLHTSNAAGVALAIVRDAGITADMPCAGCGEELEFVPVVHGDTYRAFLICETCDRVMEL